LTKIKKWKKVYPINSTRWQTTLKHTRHHRLLLIDYDSYTITDTDSIDNSLDFRWQLFSNLSGNIWVKSKNMKSDKYFKSLFKWIFSMANSLSTTDDLPSFTFSTHFIEQVPTHTNQCLDLENILSQTFDKISIQPDKYFLFIFMIFIFFFQISFRGKTEAVYRGRRV